MWLMSFSITLLLESMGQMRSNPGISGAGKDKLRGQAEEGELLKKQRKQGAPPEDCTPR